MSPLPGTLWAASLACLGMIVGSFSRWATAFGFISVTGIHMYGSTEVAFGIVGLGMVGAHRLTGARFPLLVATGAGVLGVNYRFLNPAGGLYLVLVSAIGLAASAALAWYAAGRSAPA